MGRTEERRARNETTFRKANEQIEDKVVDLELGERPTPYVCECEDERCTTVVSLRVRECEAVRASPKHFLVAPGHQSPEDRVVEQRGRFNVVEKTGKEGRLVEAENPRA